MPPGPGTGKKMGGSIARQRSRNTTPSSSSVAAAAANSTASANAATFGTTSTPTTGGAAASGSAARSATPLPPTANLPDTTKTSLKLFDSEVELLVLARSLTYDDLVDIGCGTGSSLPDYRSVDGIIGRLKKLLEMTDDHGRNFDRGMRLLSQIRRTRMDQAVEDRSREEERLQRELAEDENGGGGGGGGGAGGGGAGGHHTSSGQKRANKKKRKAPPDGGGGDAVQSKSGDAMDIDDKKAGDASAGAAAAAAGGKDGSSNKKKGAAAAAAESEESESESSEDDGAPPPRPLPQHQTFGEDPSTFPDPTVYEIREVTPGMSLDEIKEIYSVASFPKSDLSDLIAGQPPDKDFSNAKPSNQINFSTFSTYIEPYFRPFTEEDLAFLRERGNRVAPFVMPKRGARHYTEIWAEEDGAMAVDSTTSASAAAGGGGGGGSDNRNAPNQPRGTIESMTDEVGETDRLSTGPLLSRLLAAMRHEHRPVDGTNGAAGDGDVGMNGSDAQNDAQPPNGFSQSISNNINNNNNSGTPGAPGGPEGEKASLPPAAYMPESATESWRKATHPKLEYKQVDERIKQELRHIGFLPFPDPSAAAGGANGTSGGAAAGSAAATTTNGIVAAGGAHAANGVVANGGGGGAAGSASGANTGASNGQSGSGSGGAAGGGDGAVDPTLAADYDGHFDDEIAARLRRLQAALREQMLVNGARKARLAELVKERMAFQEYQTILEDLDGQVNAAYLKRTRTMGKTKKGKRPGGAGGAAGASAAAAAAAAAGTARPGIGDLTRTLMERRKRWMESIGPVFDTDKMRRVPRSSDPDSSIFKPEEMAALVKREKEAWDEEVEEE